MRRKRLTNNQKEWRKQRQRITKFIKRYEEKGYRFDLPKNLLKEPKKVTKKSIEKLKGYTPQQLRNKASAISDITGKIVTGAEKYKEERSFISRKAAETRKYKKWLQSPEGIAYKQAQENAKFEIERRLKDELDKMKSALIRESEIIKQKIYDLIDQYPTRGAKFLSNALRSEISRFGEEKVFLAIADAPYNMIQKAEDIIHYLGNLSSEEAHNAILDFVNIIRGTIPNLEELKDVGNVMDVMQNFELPE